MHSETMRLAGFILDLGLRLCLGFFAAWVFSLVNIQIVSSLTGNAALWVLLSYAGIGIRDMWRKKGDW